MAPKPKKPTKAAKAHAAAEEKAAAEEAARLAAAAAARAAAAPVPEGVDVDGDVGDGGDGGDDGDVLHSGSEHANTDSDTANLTVKAPAGSETKELKGKGKRPKRDPVLLTDEKEIRLLEWVKENPMLYSRDHQYRHIKPQEKKDLWETVAGDYDKSGKFYV